MTTADHDEVGDGGSEIWARPHGQLLELPPNIRWEVTRRHPYYVLFWREAARFYRNESGPDPKQRILDRACYYLLLAIGVTSSPPDPETPFEQLDLDPMSPTLSLGTVQPITIHALVTALVRTLPDAELRFLGGMFAAAGGTYQDEEDIPDEPRRRKERALESFYQIESPAFASVLDMPLWYVHVEASQRTIQADMERLVKAWKVRRSTQDRRLSKKKFEEYLAVWDAREGWTGCRYDGRQSKKFSEIAKERNRKTTSVFDQYREAFRLITGHAFNYTLWCRLIAPFHLSQLLQGDDDYLTRPVRRRLQPNVRRPVPESVLVSPTTKDGRRPDLWDTKGAVSPRNEGTDFLNEVMTAIRSGVSDQQICEMFPLSERPPAEKVRALRKRMGELREFGSDNP